jgi:hypothetical protein
VGGCARRKARGETIKEARRREARGGEKKNAHFGRFFCISKKKVVPLWALCNKRVKI